MLALAPNPDPFVSALQPPDPTPADHAAPDSALPDDELLLRRIATGDRLAFTLLARRHAPRVLRLADRLLGRTGEAEEVVQEAMLRVWTRAGEWDPGRETRFTTWLYRVVVNLCLDRRRRPGFAPLDAAPDIPDPAPGVVALAARRQAAQKVQDALAALNDRQRAAIVLFYFEEMPAPEAAEALNLSVAALESLLARARRILRDRLTALGLTGLEEVP